MEQIVSRNQPDETMVDLLAAEFGVGTDFEPDRLGLGTRPVDL